MKRFILLASLFSFFAVTTVFAQEEDYEKGKKKTRTNQESNETIEDYTDNEVPSKGFNWQKVRLGGNFSLQFGNQTQIEISPTFGYKVIDRLLIGGGMRFSYYKLRAGTYQSNGNIFNTNGVSTILYGPSIFAQYTVWDNLFIKADYELINKEPFNTNENGRINVSHLLLGAGYAIPVGNSGEFYISAMINVLNQSESVYQGIFGSFPLILRIGFGFGGSGRRAANR